MIEELARWMLGTALVVIILGWMARQFPEVSGFLASLAGSIGLLGAVVVIALWLMNRA